MEEKKPTVKKKLLAITHNTLGVIECLRTFSHYSMDNSNWRATLEPIVVKFTEFLTNRNADIKNYADVAQYGSMFLTTHPHFTRGEHILNNLKLSPAERIETEKQLTDAFGDFNMKQDILVYAAAVGWATQELLTPYVDQEEVEKELQERLEAIRINISNKNLSEKILVLLTGIKKGILLADGLEKAGIDVLDDGSVFPLSEKTQSLWDKGSHTDEAGDVDPLPEFKEYQTELGKLICSCTSYEKL